jgi:hypothetical protein
MTDGRRRLLPAVFVSPPCALRGRGQLGARRLQSVLNDPCWALVPSHRTPGVAAEVGRLGDRRLTPGDVARLRYTVQVLHEALRLCPPLGQ